MFLKLKRVLGCLFTERPNRCFRPVNDAPLGTVLPKRSDAGSAGYDFYAPCDILVPAHGFSRLVFSNVKAYMLPDEYLGISVRSSLAIKRGLTIPQGEAVIDASYADNPANDGNIGIMFYNRSDEDYIIKRHERCCQGIFKKYLVTDDDETSGDRVGGFGSSGK